jgi:hypothetical protein
MDWACSTFGDSKNKDIVAKILTLVTKCFIVLWLEELKILKWTGHVAQLEIARTKTVAKILTLILGEFVWCYGFDRTFLLVVMMMMMMIWFH